LLLAFTSARTGKPCHRLGFTDLDAATVSAFLDHLEHQRGNRVRTRNARLAAIHSLFAYAALRHPEHADDIGRVLSMPAKRGDHTVITYLTDIETQAMLDAPDRATRTGRRDKAILALAVQTGLRASELISLTRNDIYLDTAAHVACRGKGRKHRITPLTAATVAILRDWISETGGTGAHPLFPSIRGGPLSPDALAQRIAVHAATAAASCPSLAGKHVTPHVLRHTAAMRLLHAGVETTVIALWLGHENVTTTMIYVEADLELKQRALDRTAPTATAAGRYRPPDQLIASSKRSEIMPTFGVPGPLPPAQTPSLSA
jgi:integrase/recombinase XerD